MTNQLNAKSAAPGDRTVAELIHDLSDQLSVLIRDELRLAKAELSEKGKRAGVGAGLFGGAGVMAFYGGGALLFAIGLGLAELLNSGWLAALIVAVVLFVIAGVLAVTGRKQVQQAVPPVPEQAVRSVKADVDEVKERVHR
jgi:hypothetical protein